MMLANLTLSLFLLDRADWLTLALMNGLPLMIHTLLTMIKFRICSIPCVHVYMYALLAL